MEYTFSQSLFLIYVAILLLPCCSIHQYLLLFVTDQYFYSMKYGQSFRVYHDCFICSPGNGHVGDFQILADAYKCSVCSVSCIFLQNFNLCLQHMMSLLVHNPVVSVGRTTLWVRLWVFQMLSSVSLFIYF